MKEAIVALIISPRPSFLVLHRTPGDRTWPDVWSLPGGKVDEGESSLEALERELPEELGKEIRIKDPTPILDREVTSPTKRNFRLMACVHRCEEFEVELSSEHDGYRWATVEEIPGMNLAPVARELIEGSNEYRAAAVQGR